MEERIRNLVYAIGFGLTLLGLLMMVLVILGVIKSPEVSLLNIVVGFGLVTVVWGLKDDVGILKGKFNSLDKNLENMVEAKFSKFEHRVLSELNKLNRDLGKLEGRLEEIKK